MRTVNFLLSIMFLLFAFLQVDDPDPVIWILIYGVMAVFCVMAIFEYYPQKFLMATAAIYTLYSLVYVPGVIDWYQSGNWAGLFDDVAKMEYPYIEEAREFLGLVICITVLVIYIIRSRKVHSVSKNTSN
jgi:hypothetical protein